MTKLLYPQEHLYCYNYSPKFDSLIKIKNFYKGDVVDFISVDNLVILVVSGEVLLSTSKYANKTFSQGEMFVLPMETKCTSECAHDSVLLSITIGVGNSFCEHFSFETLSKLKLSSSSKYKEDDLFYTLKTNDILDAYFLQLISYYKDGLKCKFFFEAKIKEFLFIMRAYYEKNALLMFFNPILNNDLLFASKVNSLYRHDITVRELASMMTVSLSGFEKRFKKVFSTTVNSWLQSKKADAIFHDINCSTYTFSELADKYSFSSPAHFNSFCKKMFGHTPGKLRKNNITYYNTISALNVNRAYKKFNEW